MKGKKQRPEPAGPPAGRLPRFPAVLTFLRCILGGGSEVAWSPAPAAREAAVAAAVLALAGSVVTAVSPALRHVCSGGASPAPAAASRCSLLGPSRFRRDAAHTPRHVTARHLGAGQAPPWCRRQRSRVPPCLIRAAGPGRGLLWRRPSLIRA